MQKACCCDRRLSIERCWQLKTELAAIVIATMYLRSQWYSLHRDAGQRLLALTRLKSSAFEVYLASTAVATSVPQKSLASDQVIVHCSMSFKWVACSASIDNPLLIDSSQLGGNRRNQLCCAQAEQPVKNTTKWLRECLIGLMVLVLDLIMLNPIIGFNS